MRRTDRKKKIRGIWVMCLVFCFIISGPMSVNASTLSGGNRFQVLWWRQDITTNYTGGKYISQLLGLNNLTADKMIETIKKNWKKGLKYSTAQYVGTFWKDGTCVNYGTKQYSGYSYTGYGYNCTGFVASVLYYANGGKKENALAKMDRQFLQLKQGREASSQTRFTDGSGWYYFFNGEQHTPEVKQRTIEKTKIYYAGVVSTAQDIQRQLDLQAKKGHLKAGYIIYFWPVGGTDCHLGIYAGKSKKGVHRMYHAFGKGTHMGVSLSSDVALSPVVTDDSSYLYIVPLPDTPVKPEYKSEWVKGKWYNSDGTQTRPYTLSWKKNSNGRWVEDTSGWCPKKRWLRINGKWYYFTGQGYCIKSGWRKIGGKKYYISAGGYAVTGWKKIGKKRYYFDKKGALQTK